jgi:hypothetical protein
MKILFLSDKRTNYKKEFAKIEKPVVYFLTAPCGGSPPQLVSDWSGYFFARQKSLSVKRAAAGFTCRGTTKKKT